MDTLVKNATLVTPWSTLTNVSIGIDGEKVIGVFQKEAKFQADHIIDAKDKYVLPGLVDCHTHFGAFLPFEEDLLTETRAAAYGGITTVFHVILEQDSIVDRIPYYVDAVDRLASVDMHFWAACMTQKHIEEIPACRGKGIKGFKFFMAYKGNEMEKVGIFGIDLAYLLQGMTAIQKADGIALVHAENYELLQHYKKLHGHENSFQAFCRSRPPICEEVDADSACRLAEKAGAALYIVHVGSGKVVDIANRYRARGNKVYLETSPRYLVIDHNGGALAHPEYALTTPAYKSPEDTKRLWQGIHDGEIDCVATDSAANQLKVKMGEGNLWKTQLSWQEMLTSLPMMMTKGVHEGHMTINQLVALCAYHPAKIYGLYPQKGIIQPGADADLIIVDPDEEAPVTAAKYPSACDYSPYEGMRLKGWPSLTMVRGKVVMENGKVNEGLKWGRVVGVS